MEDLGNVLEDVALITSSNASKQARIVMISEWLRNMGKKNSEINNIISGKVDLSAGVSIIELKKGAKVWRFERTVGNIEPEKHFFTDAYAADGGVKAVGFADPSGYKLVTYEIMENTQVLKTKMNTGYIQYITDKLQNNIKIILEEGAH
ncbi:hypothetical protein [Flavobacterium piscis]|uniref:HK97 gp10 family phage protein n=1 Tax=Flavobacterium piscis TaxID=1114874 RepID=A0ABU1YCJ1_9FLAO|nr:hypothetical protein [Flavobacterium piscis]MDR7211944.1 hypothetical protein [Flavobacterium piscis]